MAVLGAALRLGARSVPAQTCRAHHQLIPEANRVPLLGRGGSTAGWTRPECGLLAQSQWPLTQTQRLPRTRFRTESVGVTSRHVTEREREREREREKRRVLARRARVYRPPRWVC